MIKAIAMMMVIFLGFSAVEAAENNAQSCTSIDLRNEKVQGPNETLRQGQRGWCYAFAAAAMVSQELGQRVSAMDIAMNHNHVMALSRKEVVTMETLLNTNSGTVGGAIKYRDQVGGFCLEKNLPWFSSNKSEGWFRDTPAVYETFMSLVEPKNPEGKVATFMKVINGMCGQRLRVDFEVLTENYLPQYPNLSNRDPFTIIDGQLISGHLPVLLADNGFFTWAAKGVKAMENRNHTVNIVGRRFNEKLGECEYILRDSANSKSEVSQESPRYEGGYLYATASQIKEFLGQIYHIQKPGNIAVSPAKTAGASHAQK